MYNIGLVGLGPMGKRHCEAIKMIPNATLFSVCDLSKKNIDFVMDEYDVANGYDSFTQMLDSKLDLIIVATNGPTHSRFVIEAADKGIKKILCEKPMATSINEARSMIKICEKNNVRLTINHSRRWMSPYMKLKKLLDSDIIGEIKHITFEMAGGQMGSNGGHFWDLVRFLTNDEADNVMGILDKTGTPNPRGGDYSDPGAFGLINMKKGARIFYDMSEDYGVPFFVEIMGTVGRVLIDEKASKWEVSARRLEDRDQPFTRRPDLEKIPFEGEKIDIITSCKEALIELLDSNKQISCTGYDGLKSLEMTVAVYNSDEKNNQFINMPIKGSYENKKFMFT